MWVGHLSKLVQQEELSDTFGKFGEIVSIDMISPRGCAFIVMYRRQDAYKSMQQLKNHKMQGRIITISWAAGKGVKSKEWKDYWDLDLGVSYIPWIKLNKNTDFETLEEGGMFDEETQPAWMKDRLSNSTQTKTAEPSNPAELIMHPFFGIPAEMTGVDTSQPPPGGLMAAMTSVPPYSMGAMPR